MNKKYTKQRLFSAIFFTGLLSIICGSMYSILSLYLSDGYIFLIFEYTIGIIILFNLYRNKMLPYIREDNL